MKIGCLKEVKDNEFRVGLTPTDVRFLVHRGHQVQIEFTAGEGARFFDQDYEDAGAKIGSKESIIDFAEIIVKVKEPVSSEYELFDRFKDKILYTYLHLANAEKGLVDCLLRNRIIGVSYDTIEDEDGNLPLLKPMSKIAGTLSIQYAAEFLQKKYGGLGQTLGNSRVLVLGAGEVGQAAANLAVGMRAWVDLYDIREVPVPFYPNLKFHSDPKSLEYLVRNADVIIGAALSKAKRTPIVLDWDLLALFKSGGVIVDVAIDQGGCIYGSRPTSHSEPVYRLDNHLYCCIPNMPGQVPREATQELTKVTFPILSDMAEQGLLSYSRNNPGFLKGWNTFRGKITNYSVASSLGMLDNYTDPKGWL